MNLMIKYQSSVYGREYNTVQEIYYDIPRIFVSKLFNYIGEYSNYLNNDDSICIETDSMEQYKLLETLCNFEIYDMQKE